MAESYVCFPIRPFGLRIRASAVDPAAARASGISTPASTARTFRFGRRGWRPCRRRLIVPVFSLFADLGIRFLIQGFWRSWSDGRPVHLPPGRRRRVIGTLSAALPWVISPRRRRRTVVLLLLTFISSGRKVSVRKSGFRP